MLEEYCIDCHDPEDDESESPFLNDLTLLEISNNRHVWRSVAAQLRNRTMPPKRKKKQPTEFERVEIANWIDSFLHSSALDMPDYAGSILSRRLNRDAYDNTVQDLLGLKLNFSSSFPIDGGGGEGFDNNGETLYLPPLLLERYLESAQIILDKAIITPDMMLKDSWHDLKVSKKQLNQKVKVFNVYVKGEVTFELHSLNANTGSKVKVFMDDLEIETVSLTGEEKSIVTKVILERGIHKIAYQIDQLHKAKFSYLEIKSKDKYYKRKTELHNKLFIFSINKDDSDKRSVAFKNIKSFAEKAFRRPVKSEEINRFMLLYDRAIKRGDPYEEAVKLALKAILISPHFLFMIEEPPKFHSLVALSNYELASRLSYFIWGSMPDSTLFNLAKRGLLQKETYLKKEIQRMLKDKKAYRFFDKFVGQWLGTKEVGRSVAPGKRDIGYTSDLGYDLQLEPIELFKYIMNHNRSLLELIDGDYVLVNERLAKHYDIEGVNGEEFRYKKIENERRGGILGLGGVHMLTSFPNRTSPILRGVWVIETILGTPVPTPPDNIPELDVKKSRKKKTVRQMFEEHRKNEACSACHSLIDPIGFGLENYDLIGKWREEENGIKLDATGTMPSGEKFDGPAELKKLILDKKDEFARHLISKMLGYALGRSLLDEDAGTIERILMKLSATDYSAHQLIESIVCSTPFRMKQLIDKDVMNHD